MKTLLGTLILLFAIQTASTAQCGINFKKDYQNKLDGTYLMHAEVKNNTEGATKRYSIILKKDTNYTIYLLNPSIPITDVKLLVNQGENPVGLKSEINTTENYSVHRFNSGDKRMERVFTIFVEFPEESVKDCVLMAFYVDEDN